MTSFFVVHCGAASGALWYHSPLQNTTCRWISCGTSLLEFLLVRELLDRSAEVTDEKFMKNVMAIHHDIILIVLFKPMIKTDQNIIKHPFSKCSNIKHLSNLNQQSSIPLIINQLWHIMIQLIKQQHPSMAPAEPLPGASSSKRRPRGLPEPGRRRAGIRGEFFRIPGAKWQKSGTTIS